MGDADLCNRRRNDEQVKGGRISTVTFITLLSIQEL